MTKLTNRKQMSRVTPPVLLRKKISQGLVWAKMVRSEHPLGVRSEHPLGVLEKHLKIVSCLRPAPRHAVCVDPRFYGQLAGTNPSQHVPRKPRMAIHQSTFDPRFINKGKCRFLDELLHSLEETPLARARSTLIVNVHLLKMPLKTAISSSHGYFALKPTGNMHA